MKEGSNPWLLPLAGLGLMGAVLIGKSSTSKASRGSSGPRPSPSSTPRLGVWVTKSALNDPSGVAAKLAAIGFSTANIMVNDHSRDRSETEFRTHDPLEIMRLASAFRARGLTVDLTTWVMPHASFIDSMASRMRGLMGGAGARYLWLDAEEPYNRARGEGIDYNAAARMIGDRLAGTPVVLSAISFARTETLAPLAQVCRYWSPQAYATTRPGSQAAAAAVPNGIERWTSRFGSRPPSQWIMGLAAYDQPSPPSLYMKPCLDAVATAGIPEACYWAHGAVLRTPAVADFIRSRSPALA